MNEQKILKNYADIKGIILNDLGIKDLKSYQEYTNKIHQDDYILSIEEIEKLSPENVNNRDFWRVAEDLFGTDSVSNTQNGALSSTRADGNRRNMKMARSLNVTYLLEEMAGYERLPILEIGVGYGALKNWIEANTKMHYTGVDVYPKLAEVEPTGIDGLLTAEQKARNYYIVVSTNVFQHLSETQKIRYLDDIKEILSRDGGYFIVNLLVKITEDHKVAEDGKTYMCHYGQFTEIPFVVDWTNELRKRFSIVMTSITNNGSKNIDLVNYVCWCPKFEPPKEESQAEEKPQENV